MVHGNVSSSIAPTGDLQVIATLADVPKESVTQDPLGFGSSVERLADVFAPGLTVGTRSVRYYQLLAAGAQLAAEAGAPDTREVVLCLERVWALASFLADPSAGNQSRSGLAGISRVRQAAAKPNNNSQKVNYPMFQRGGQARMGVWGLYRKSAERLLLVDGFEPTLLGTQLAEPFLAYLECHHLRKSALGKAKTALTQSLTGFGATAGLFCSVDVETAAAAWNALRNHPNRCAAAKTLRTAKPSQGNVPSQDDLLVALGQLSQFAEAADAALALEASFGSLIRLFDAAVFLTEQESWVDPSLIRTNPALKNALREWKQVAFHGCQNLLRGGVDAAVVELCRSIADATDPWEAVLVLVERHHQVQEAKGRQPWIEWRGGHIVRVAAAPTRGYLPFDPDGIPRGHDFRLGNLRALARDIYAAGVKLT
jgi:hypothetical protein